MGRWCVECNGKMRSTENWLWKEISIFLCGKKGTKEDYGNIGNLFFIIKHEVI